MNNKNHKFFDARGFLVNCDIGEFNPEITPIPDIEMFLKLSYLEMDAPILLGKTLDRYSILFRENVSSQNKNRYTCLLRTPFSWDLMVDEDNTDTNNTLMYDDTGHVSEVFKPIAEKFLKTLFDKLTSGQIINHVDFLDD
jgi:hypothetical protein